MCCSLLLPSSLRDLHRGDLSGNISTVQYRLGVWGLLGALFSYWSLSEWWVRRKDAPTWLARGKTELTFKKMEQTQLYQVFLKVENHDLVA